MIVDEKFRIVAALLRRKSVQKPVIFDAPVVVDGTLHSGMMSRT